MLQRSHGSTLELLLFHQHHWHLEFRLVLVYLI